jgi:hypothetical protein
MSLLPSPEEVNDWAPEDEPEYAAGEDLFYLINGAAAIYREYGFKEAVYQTYVNGDGRSINLEIYAMDTPQAAFGIYTFKTGLDGTPVDSIHGGWYESYYLNFWKGDYQVTVTGFDADDTTPANLVDIAKVVDRKITSDSPTPQIVSVFSHEKLLPNGITYLKGNLAIFNKYLFDRKNIFGLQEGAIGEYEDHSIFIFEYKDRKESKTWYGSAKEFLKQSERFSGFTQVEAGFEIEDVGGDRLFVTAHDRWIIVVKGRHTIDAETLIEHYTRSLK